MNLTFDKYVKAVNNISYFVDIISLFNPNILNPSTNINEYSKISSNTWKVRLIFK